MLISCKSRIGCCLFIFCLILCSCSNSNNASVSQEVDYQQQFDARLKPKSTFNYAAAIKLTYDKSSAEAVLKSDSDKFLIAMVASNGNTRTVYYTTDTVNTQDNGDDWEKSNFEFEPYDISMFFSVYIDSYDISKDIYIGRNTNKEFLDLVNEFFGISSGSLDCEYKKSDDKYYILITHENLTLTLVLFDLNKTAIESLVK